MGKKDNGGSTGYNGPPVVQTGLEGGFGINIPSLNPPAEPEPFAFEFPDFSAQNAQTSADYEAKLAEQQAEQQKILGENDRDSLYSDYVSAASSATDYINNQIREEQSNASLLGIDYAIDDEAKSSRISDYFASIWGAGDQSRLEGLIGEWGGPQGFDGFSVTRGDAGKIKSASADESGKGTSSGRRPTLVAEEDAKLGGNTSLLGA